MVVNQTRTDELGFKAVSGCVFFGSRGFDTLASSGDRWRWEAYAAETRGNSSTLVAVAVSAFRLIALFTDGKSKAMRRIVAICFRRWLRDGLFKDGLSHRTSWV